VDDEPHVVVGVVRDAQYYAASEAPRGQVFLNYWQAGATDAFLKDARIHVRVAGDPHAALAALRREVAALDPSVPINEDYVLTDRLAFAYQAVRTARAVISSLGVLSLLLSAIGLYGVLAFNVAQRTPEIGLRVALGAERTQVAALIVRDALSMTSVGLITGMVAAGPASRLLLNLLYGVNPADAAAWIGAPAIVLGVSLVAALLPAHRASGVSPLAALRHD
jgi:ABC-type antimicrobial peptide transport system permease subunit